MPISKPDILWISHILHYTRMVSYYTVISVYPRNLQQVLTNAVYKPSNAEANLHAVLKHRTRQVDMWNVADNGKGYSKNKERERVERKMMIQVEKLHIAPLIITLRYFSSKIWASFWFAVLHSTILSISGLLGLVKTAAEWVTRNVFVSWTVSKAKVFWRNPRGMVR